MSNVITEGALSGNIIDTISDHLGQFIILRHHCITSNSKWEIFQRNLKSFSQNNLLSDLKKTKQK